MADKKISALTAASTPLAGTEVLPIVQGGSTVKVSVDNLTVGKFVRAGSFQADGAIKATSATFGASDITAETTAASGSGFSRVILKTADREWRIVNDASTVGSPFLLYDVQSVATALSVDSSGNFTANRGNVVIGTTAKGITTGSAIPLGLGVNNTVTAITIDTASSVGVGTATPATKFHVLGTGSGTFITFGSSYAMGRLGEEESTNTVFVANGYSASRLSFRVNGITAGDEKMCINTSGNVGIGTNAPAATAILDVQSTTKGVRFPNMTTAQKNLITPSAGTVIFDTDLAKLCVYSGAAWQTITSL